MNHHEPESLLEGAFTTVLLMVMLAVAVMLPLLLCEFIAALLDGAGRRANLPLPKTEMRQE